MDYIKIDIEITPFEEWLRDVVMAQLAEIGFDSFVETDHGLEAYAPVDGFEDDVVQKIINSYSDKFQFVIRKELIKSQNWNELWEKNYFQPLVVADECVVRAPFHADYPKCKYHIVIEPNMAFGTGNHETTYMMMEAVLKNDFVDSRVLDMGSGTGILGILASMRGASSIDAIDIDEWSVKASSENAALNNITNLSVQKGDSSLLSNDEYDYIFANIQRNVLLNDMQRYSEALKRGGKLFVSGFYESDLSEINKSAEKNGLQTIGYSQKDEWIAAFYRKS